MKKITQLLSAFLSVVMVSQFIAVPVYAEKLTNDNKSENSGNTFVYSAVNLGIDYIESNRDEYGVWSTLSDCAAAYVIDTIESLNAFGISENQTAELINTSVGPSEKKVCKKSSNCGKIEIISQEADFYGKKKKRTDERRKEEYHYGVAAGVRHQDRKGYRGRPQRPSRRNYPGNA